MKKVMLMLLTLVMVLSFTACGGNSDDPNLGMYTCTEISMEGLSMEGDGDYVELKSGGKATMVLSGEDYSGKWSLDGETFTLEQAGSTYTGTLSNGVLTIDFEGMIFTYVKDGETNAASNEASESTGALQEFWNGGWYGYWSMTNCTGSAATLEGSSWDCLAEVNIDENGNGTLVIWDADLPKEDGVAEIDISIGMDDEALSDNGVMTAEGGWFMDGDVSADDFTADPAAYDDQNTLMISGSISYDTGGGDYIVILRPWGQLWNDMIEDDLQPYNYEYWYLPLVEDGADMPDELPAN